MSDLLVIESRVIDSYREVMDHAYQDAGNTVLAFNGSTITLENLSMSSLRADNFLFVPQFDALGH